MMRRGVFLLATIAVTASGCTFWRDEDPCESVEEYQQARSAGEIVVPAGLSPPDSTGRLVIPPGPTEAGQPLSANAACLQKPPDYFNKPVTPPPGN